MDAEEEDVEYDDDDDEVEAHADAEEEAEEELQPVESWARLGARKLPFLKLELLTITTFSESVTVASPAKPSVKGNERNKKKLLRIFIFK